MLAFPFEEVMRQLSGHWSTWADTLYRNWLGEVRRRVSDEVLAEAQLAV